MTSSDTYLTLKYLILLCKLSSATGIFLIKQFKVSIFIRQKCCFVVPLFKHWLQIKKLRFSTKLPRRVFSTVFSSQGKANPPPFAGQNPHLINLVTFYTVRTRITPYFFFTPLKRKTYSKYCFLYTEIYYSLLYNNLCH